MRPRYLMLIVVLCAIGVMGVGVYLAIVRGHEIIGSVIFAGGVAIAYKILDLISCAFMSAGIAMQAREKPAESHAEAETPGSPIVS